MKRYISILILVCAAAIATAQTNFVKNPSFEKYNTCPTHFDELIFATFWRGTFDSTINKNTPEYYNKCANYLVLDHAAHVPDNTLFYQNPHTKDGMAGGVFYYDKTPPYPPSSSPFSYRDNIQGHLHRHLEMGKTYCVSFWINCVESFGYAHNKIGAYLDNGAINLAVDSVGKEITSVIPQVYTDSVIRDTMNWTKIEGSFVASGNETYITIGNFFSNAATTTVVTDYWHGSTQSSYYLLDDVSVIPIDLAADAGKDNWVEIGKQVQIGRVGDTTAEGLDCKWYHKGALIDSGAIITVNANSVVNAIDTYVVVQTICGLVKTDTVTVKTAGLGVAEYGLENSFNIYPNPSGGTITVTTPHAVVPTKEGTLSATIYDLLGRVAHQQNLSFNNKEATLKLNLPSATYILELKDEAGNVQRERIVVQ